MLLMNQLRTLLEPMTTLADNFWTTIRISIVLDPRTCMFQLPQQRVTNTRLSPVMNLMIIHYLKYILAWTFNV